MKRGILVATLMMTVAGVASANLLTTSPRDVTSPSPTRQAPQARAETLAPPAVAKSNEGRVDNKMRAQPALAATTPATPVLAPTTPAKVASSQTAHKATAEAQQAPVPFQMKPRPPANLPPVEETATEAKPAVKPAETVADAVGDVAGESAARAAIEADGYKSVKLLRKGTNGVWHASGLRGKTTVMLTVDSSGSVLAD